MSDSVNNAVKDGYEISHIGLFLWCPAPSALMQYPMRCLMLVFETVFAMVFWTMRSKTKDWFMPSLCPWPRDTFEYDGLCTHFSLFEAIFGFSDWQATQHLDPEAVAKLEQEREQEAKACKQKKHREYKANLGEGVHAAAAKASKEKTLASGTFTCEPCAMWFTGQGKLDVHLGGQEHINMITHGGPTSALKQRAKNWCKDCNWGARSPKALVVHLAGKRHAKRLRMLAIAST